MSLFSFPIHKIKHCSSFFFFSQFLILLFSSGGRGKAGGRGVLFGLVLENFSHLSFFFFCLMNAPLHTDNFRISVGIFRIEPAHPG